MRLLVPFGDVPSRSSRFRGRDRWACPRQAWRLVVLALVLGVGAAQAADPSTPTIDGKSGETKLAEKLAERKPTIGEAGRPAVLAYRLKNYVGVEVPIGDGYVDGGHGMTIHADGKVSSSREILTVDRNRDVELQKHLAYAAGDDLKKLNSLDRATRLARYVAAHFTPKEGRRAIEEKSRVLETTYRNREVLIGDVATITGGAGVCRHRALMYKVLADAAGLKVTLVRGLYGRDPAKAGYHSWNELLRDDGQLAIVDTTNPQPDFHFPDLRSPQAARYLTPSRQPKYPVPEPAAVP